MENKTAVFLSGGGAKGPFQIGFFKALEDFAIKPDLICGSSIGALIAGAATYMDAYELMECWKNLTLESVLQVDEKMLLGLNEKDRIRRLYFETFLSCLRPPRLLIDIENIRGLLYSSLNGEKILEANTDFGISTTEIPSFRLRKIFKEDMSCNPLDYILASLYLPFFRPQKIIDGKHYLDIAPLRRYPLEMVCSEKYSTVFIVNISAQSEEKMNHDIANTNFGSDTNIIVINMDKKSSYLDFSEELAQINFQKGYESSLYTLSRKMK